MAEVYSRRDAIDIMGAGFHRAAFPADDKGGKRRVVLDKASTLARIEDAINEIHQMEYELEATIGAALTAGATWSDIATATGISARQNAARKFGRARLTYVSQPETERARLDKLAGVGARRITFEVEDGAGELVSRHQSADVARRAAAKWDRTPHANPDLTPATVWKVYPQGRRVPLT